jgi:hypothetical protein
LVAAPLPCVYPWLRPSRANSLAFTNLNHDGRPDIVIGYVETPGSVYFNTCPHNFHEVRWNDGKGIVYGLAFANFNGDGWLDIAAARSDAPNALWFSTEPFMGVLRETPKAGKVCD